mmetsp:Transcript_6581/g.10586  ORF Transcript_6581/g.10586 Transcript_6581/m.10586 type:complete len:158 (-) Transcript_6581:360-833(-)|eukprot:CAMPEP_0170497200 /NCGR_PEP_ID=MMETSP0208-20121228/24029_1 /TAXON_ID=197538 /ORGANISM="Strombidium inclinatum, Strain S3" /LENGTH=157 /DNA_ID=CAMNT_0010773939 /DNA_START=1021 /DNA_END=1494 /DNA_ORIENTATION=-
MILHFHVMSKFFDGIAADVKLNDLRSDSPFFNYYNAKLQGVEDTTDFVNAIFTPISAQPKIHKDLDKDGGLDQVSLNPDDKKEAGFFKNFGFAAQSLNPWSNHLQEDTYLEWSPSGDSMMYGTSDMTPKSAFVFIVDSKYPFEVEKTTYYTTFDFLS